LPPVNKNYSLTQPLLLLDWRHLKAWVTWAHELHSHGSSESAMRFPPCVRPDFTELFQR